MVFKMNCMPSNGIYYREKKNTKTCVHEDRLTAKFRTKFINSNMMQYLSYVSHAIQNILTEILAVTMLANHTRMAFEYLTVQLQNIHVSTNNGNTTVAFAL